MKKKKELIKVLSGYWERLQEIQCDFYSQVTKLEDEMRKETKIDDIIFFLCDDGYIGIGNESRTMDLMQNDELRGRQI